MALKLIDSDVVIDHLNGRRHQAVLDALSAQELATTVITRFEVLCGARTETSLADTLGFFGALICFAFDDAAADRAAEIDRALRPQGLVLPAADTMIAGIALSQGLPLLTRNQRYFARIPGLVLIEP